jgi:hypothetical protein
MRYIFAVWAAPLVLFWGWFFVSLNDMNFGYVMLSRQFHDLLFQVYGQILGIDPVIIPGMVAKACIVDTLLLLAFWAFRRRKAIMAWIREKREGRDLSGLGVQLAQPVENALQDKGRGSRIDLPGSFVPRKVHLDQGALGSHGR